MTQAEVGRLAGCLIWVPEVRSLASGMLEPRHFSLEPDLALLWQAIRNLGGEHAGDLSPDALRREFTAICTQAARLGTISQRRRAQCLAISTRFCGRSWLRIDHVRPTVLLLITNRADWLFHRPRVGIPLLRRFLEERLFWDEVVDCLGRFGKESQEYAALRHRLRPLRERMRSWPTP